MSAEYAVVTLSKQDLNIMIEWYRNYPEDRVTVNISDIAYNKVNEALTRLNGETLWVIQAVAQAV